MTWTDEMRDRLRALHKILPELSFVDIAEQMSIAFNVELSKNACIGMARRLQLPERKTHKFTKATRAMIEARRHMHKPPPKPTTKPRPRPQPQPPSDKVVVPIIAEQSQQPHWRPGSIWPVEVPMLPASSGRKTLYQLSHRDCRFPLGSGPPYAYCGNTVQLKSTYCPHHHRVMFNNRYNAPRS